MESSKLPTLLCYLIFTLLIACGGGEKPAEKPKDATPGLLGSRTVIPIFKPSRPVYRDPFPPHERTGFQWTIATDNALEDVIVFYDGQELPDVKRSELKPEKKKKLLGVRYEYTKGDYYVEILLRKGTIKIAECPAATMNELNSTPQPTATP